MKLALSAANAPPMLVGATRLLAAIAGLAMATTGECSPIVLVLYLVFFLIGLRVEAFAVLTALLGLAQPFFALIILALAVADFFTVSQSFLLAVAHFLLGIQALRLTSLRTNRENLGSVLISSLMVLSASTLAVDWTFFVALAAFLPGVVWTLMLHTIALESDLAGNGGQEAARALNSASPTWRRMSPALRWCAAGAFLVSAVCCAFVFVTFPRFNFQGFRGQFLQPLHKTGFTSQVDLEKTGRIYEDPAIVMRVVVNPADRARWTGYMRGSVLDQFDGRLWKRASRPVERAFPTGIGEFRLRMPGEGPWIRQNIYLESMDTPVLFAAPHPFFVRIERPFLEVTPDGTIQRRQSDAWRIHYEVVSSASASNERFLTGSSIHSGGSYARTEVGIARLLPELRHDRLAALAGEVGGSGRPSEIAERIAGHLRENYKYSLAPAAPDGSMPVERFLFTTKTGHCEYFASALTLMLRYRGVPARIVTGFLSREWNSRGDYYIVRLKHAHAWVEYFEPSLGWVQIDPSPRAVDEGGAGAGMRRKVREAWDYLNLRWNRYILSYDLEKQIAIIRSFSHGSGKISGGLAKAFGKLKKMLDVDGFDWRPAGGADFRIPTGAVAAAGGAVSLALLAALAWKRRRGVWFHAPLVRALEKAGARASADRTLKELIGEAEPALGGALEEARFLAEEYHRIRFGGASAAVQRRQVSERLKRIEREVALARRKRPVAMLKDVKGKALIAALALGLSALAARPAAAQPRVLALGDSYTVGTAVEERRRWINELVRLLRDAAVDVADPEVIAQAGWSTEELLSALEREKPKGPYGLVTLMIGVNNQFRGGSLAVFRREAAALIKRGVALAGGDARRLIVVSIPDYGATPFAQDREPAKISAAIAEFNGALREETRKAGAKFVDVTTVSKAAARNPTQLVAEDGLHPSWRLHAVWARIIYPVARPILDRLR